MRGLKIIMSMRKIRDAKPANSEDTTGFKNLLKRAMTEMLVLLILNDGQMYTYEMMISLERRSKGYLTFNTLYIAIYRLKELLFIEESGKTRSDENRTRVYFSITDAGRRYLNNLIEEYGQFSNVIEDMISKTKRKTS